MSVPGDRAGWVALIRGAQAPCWSLIATGSGGAVWERDGVTAAIVPAAPERSVLNSVFYEDPRPLLDSLDEIADAYESAGISAWAVWVPEDEVGTGEALQEAGHVLDSNPRLMGLDLTGLLMPEPEPSLAIVERLDHGAMVRLNEIAYGYPPGELEAVERAEMPGMRIWFGSLDGEEVTTLAVWPHGRDAHVMWVATLPEARNRGLAGRLLAHALAVAREEDGLQTSSLESSKLGRAVYTRLGYRDFGAAQMWERREPA